MKTIMKEPLIKGRFDKETAIDVLTTLFTSKIQLHNVKTFNCFIRNGVESYEDNVRKTELKNSIERLLDAIKNTDKSHHAILIDCEVVLSIPTQNENVNLEITNPSTENQP